MAVCELPTPQHPRGLFAFTAYLLERYQMCWLPRSPLRVMVNLIRFRLAAAALHPPRTCRPFTSIRPDRAHHLHLIFLICHPLDLKAFLNNKVLHPCFTNSWSLFFPPDSKPLQCLLTLTHPHTHILRRPARASLGQIILSPVPPIKSSLPHRLDGQTTFHSSLPLTQ